MRLQKLFLVIGIIALVIALSGILITKIFSPIVLIKAEVEQNYHSLSQLKIASLFHGYTFSVKNVDLVTLSDKEALTSLITQARSRKNSLVLLSPVVEHLSQQQNPLDTQRVDYTLVARKLTTLMKGNPLVVALLWEEEDERSHSESMSFLDTYSGVVEHYPLKAYSQKEAEAVMKELQEKNVALIITPSLMHISWFTQAPFSQETQWIVDSSLRSIVPSSSLKGFVGYNMYKSVKPYLKGNITKPQLVSDLYTGFQSFVGLL